MPSRSFYPYAFSSGAGAAQSLALRGELGALGGAIALIIPQMGGLGNAIIDLAGVLGPFKLAMDIAGKAVELGFQAVSKSAMELVGAIAQLGGAKGLQEMMIESVTIEKDITRARFAVGPEERSTSKELHDLIYSLSERAELGAFSSAEWIQSIEKIGAMASVQTSISRQTLELLGKFGLISGAGVVPFANVYGTLKAQNPQMSEEQLRGLMLSGFKIGQETTFELSEMPTALKAIRQAYKLSGGPGEPTAQNIRESLVLGSLVSPYAGGLIKGGTEYQSFIQQGRLATQNQQTNKLLFDKAGQLTNLPEVLDWVMSTNTMNLPKNMMARESGNFITNLRHAASQRAGVADEDFSQEATSKRREAIKSLVDLTTSEEELNKMVEESLTPQEQFRAALNKVSNNLEATLLPVLKQMEPVIQNFADTIVANKDKIGSFFLDLVKWLAVAVELLPQFLDAIGFLGRTVVDVGIALINFLIEQGIMKGRDKLPTTKEEAAQALTEAEQRKSEAIDRLLEMEAKKARGEVGQETVDAARKDVEDERRKVAQAQRDKKMFTDLSPETMQEKAAAREKKDESDRLFQQQERDTEKYLKDLEERRKTTGTHAIVAAVNDLHPTLKTVALRVRREAPSLEPPTRTFSGQ